MSLANEHTRPGGVVFVCMDWRSIAELVAATRVTGLDFINLCVWNKNNGGMGSLYRSKYELVIVARVPGAPPTNNVALGQHGRNRTNVWDYPGASTPGSDASKGLDLHPTVKPVALVADALLDVSKRGETVLDMFGGSGTTLLAAERTSRKARLIELDPAYVDTAVVRFQEIFGVEAILLETGQSFGEVRDERARLRRPTAATSQVRTRKRPAITGDVRHTH